MAYPERNEFDNGLDAESLTTKERREKHRQTVEAIAALRGLHVLREFFGEQIDFNALAESKELQAWLDNEGGWIKWSEKANSENILDHHISDTVIEATLPRIEDVLGNIARHMHGRKYPPG